MSFVGLSAVTFGGTSLVIDFVKYKRCNKWRLWLLGLWSILSIDVETCSLERSIKGKDVGKNLGREIGDLFAVVRVPISYKHSL